MHVATLDAVGIVRDRTFDNAKSRRVPVADLQRALRFAFAIATVAPVQRVLQQRGAVVFATGSVGAALEALESWGPDVLVSDTGSPERDSYALVGKVRSLDVNRGGRIPALALTTFARTDERVRALLASVLRDLPKPVKPNVLTWEIAWLTEPARRRARGEDT